VEDVFESYGIAGPTVAPAAVGEEAEGVLERIRGAAAGADELARATGLDAKRLAVLLSELELAGAVVEENGVYRPAR
jgi:predicted Rossmann fold nucleotide-binding protein DprA/Smf involved in DNA uptake